MTVQHYLHFEEAILVLACVLVCCEAGKYSAVANAVRGIGGVKLAFPVTGRWDVVVEIEAADLKGLSDIALKINGLPGVKCTETLVQVGI